MCCFGGRQLLLLGCDQRSLDALLVGVARSLLLKD
jgi:hypothetical protein